MPKTPRNPQAGGLSARALSTPEPFVRQFARRVQQEGALDLTQGDYKNADFAPHPEVVRAAQRITRNTVHSYGPAVGRMDVRSEVAEFFNRDGLLDYPDSEVRFQPDEVLFTPGTRAGLAIVLEVLGADGSGVVVPRPSWEYDWFIERAGKRVVELATAAPGFLPDPQELDRLLARGGISSVIINNPHNPTGRVYPRELVEELVRVAVRHRCYVLYDSVYQRLDYVGWFVNPAFACPEWRDWVVSLSGLSKMDMFGASTGARACWLVISDQVRSNGVRAREILANLSAWLVATPSTLAQDWALAALQSPLAALRRPSPYMRERRDFMLRAADELAHLGIERTDFGGTFYAPLAFPGLVGEPFDRLRNGVHEPAVVRDSVDAFELLLSGGVGGIPFVAFAGGGDGAARYGTWQRLSYGSKDVKELAVFMDRVKARIEKQGRLGRRRGRARPPAHLARRRVGKHLHGRSIRCARRSRSGGVRHGPATLPRAAAARIAAPDGHQAPRFDGAPRRAGRARAARVAGGRTEPRAAGADPPRVEPADGSAGRIRGVDRRPARALQRGAARPRGPADQPGLARRAGEGRARPAAAGHRAGRGPAHPVPRAQSLHRAGRGEGREDPRCRRARQRAVPPRLRAPRHHAAAERDPRDQRAADQLDRRDRCRDQDRHAVPAGGRGTVRGPAGTRRRVPGGARAAGAAGGNGGARPARATRAAVRERGRAQPPAGPAREVLRGARAWHRPRPACPRPTPSARRSSGAKPRYACSSPCRTRRCRAARSPRTPPMPSRSRAATRPSGGSLCTPSGSASRRPRSRS